MPVISEFLGIYIYMYYNDHAPPHFHAKYGNTEALITISPLGLMKGNLSPRILGLVLEWASMYQEKLLEDWNLASNKKQLQKIPPLE